MHQMGLRLIYLSIGRVDIYPHFHILKKEWNINFHHPSSSSLPEATSGNPYPLSHFISYARYNSPHIAFLSAITSCDEPKTYSQGVKDPKWREAMSKEIAPLEQNHT